MKLNLKNKKLKNNEDEIIALKSKNKKNNENLNFNNKKHLFGTIQLGIVIVVFLLWLSGALFIESYILPFFIIPFVIGNIVFLFINKTKGLPVNVIMMLLTFVQFVFLLEYLATVIGAFLSLYHTIRIGIWWWKTIK
ncbi:hypothetical protein HN587_04405 [Candidatus Woesearchaeota archaeon]|jgi:hypothetical protein|nr:hypothetical protein [Candidatus Woesearchaeota archaeon]